MTTIPDQSVPESALIRGTKHTCPAHGEPELSWVGKWVPGVDGEPGAMIYRAKYTCGCRQVFRVRQKGERA